MKRLLMAWGAVLAAGLAGAAETEIQYLSGSGKDDGVPWEFFCTAGMRSKVWTTIPVPSCWEQQGFGAYGYQVDPLCEIGQYRHRFFVPEAWKDRVVRLVFEGAMTDTEAWLNGQPAGPKHQGGFTRFAYDVTALVKPGASNLLEVTVAKRSSNEGVNRAERTGDYWNFGGIFRPVVLEALPKTHIERMAVDARADGTCALEVYLNGDMAKAERVRVSFEGLGATAEAEVDRTARKAVLRATVSGQKNWTAETPDLYRAKVDLLGGGETIHTVTQRFGFRTVEVREGQGLFVNGQRVLLKGACRHSFWPEFGRTLSEAVSRADVALMKEMNMNAARMSHYPPDTHFLDACDEMGLYVLDELSGWQKAHDTEVGEKLVREMVTRDVNHPCILLWDNGNEGGWNTDLDDDFALWDPQKRRVLHPWAVSQGVDTAHYRNYETVVKSLAGTNVYLPTEFLHALYDGGGGAGLDDYWEAMRVSPVSAGGFIWALVDEGVARTDLDGKIDVHGNRGPDGLVGPHREREGSFYTVREIWSPVQVTCDAPPLLAVENRYDFTRLDSCRFEWSLVRFPGPAADGTWSVVAHGSEPGPAVAPHASGTLPLPLPAGWREADALFVTVRDPAGREVWTWSWPLQAREAQCSRVMRGGGGGPVRIDDAPDRITVSAGGLALSFGKRDGRLSAVSVQNQAVSFANGPRFVASATQTVKQNQGEGKKPKAVTSMRDLSGESALARLTSRMEGEDAVVEAAYEGALRATRWTVKPNGWVRLDYRYSLDQACDLAGIQFDYPEKYVESLRWLGKGPCRVWKNRLKGTWWNVWQNAYSDAVPGESWEYPEFKGYFGDWLWATFKTAEKRSITLMAASDGTFLGVYRPNEGSDPARTKLYTPQTGLAVFDAIPPIGTKFSDADQYGPQSQPNPAPGECRRTLYLRFD
jgi:hypothetical protein